MKFNLVSIALVRVFAIAVVIYALSNAGMTVLFIAHGESSIIEIYMLIVGIVVPVMIAAFMWTFPEKVIGRPLNSGSDAMEQPLDGGMAFSVGVALMGMYLAITSIPPIVSWFVRNAQQREAMGDLLYVAPPSYMSLFSDIFMLVVGVLLFLGASQITRLFLALRSYGVDVPSRAAGEDKQPSVDRD